MAHDTEKVCRRKPFTYTIKQLWSGNYKKGRFGVQRINATTNGEPDGPSAEKTREFLMQAPIPSENMLRKHVRIAYIPWVFTPSGWRARSTYLSYASTRLRNSLTKRSSRTSSCKAFVQRPCTPYTISSGRQKKKRTGYADSQCEQEKGAMRYGIIVHDMYVLTWHLLYKNSTSSSVNRQASSYNPSLEESG